MLFEDMKDLKAFEKLMQINFFGMIYPTRYALPYLKKSKGQIVVMSSYSGEIGLPLRTAYCSSKFAVNGFFEALKIEMWPQRDVAITIICPTKVDTDMRKNSMDHVEEPIVVSKDIMEGYTGHVEKAIPLDEAVDVIMKAVDARIGKLYYHNMAFIGAYLRPFFPDYVDRRLAFSSRL